ncbi:Transposase family Tnp2 protein [Ceratobasidium sp. AG-Ba]|nr:Transposase family Tnp2 protein [Ceratobasidium sp. AG-Ba]
MAKGWLRRAESYWIVRQMQEIEDPTEDDTLTTEILLKAMRDGPEYERQCGILNAILAGEARFRDQEFIRLAKVPAKVDFQHSDHAPYYQMVVDFCSNLIEDGVFYAQGQRPPGGIYFPPQGTTLLYPHFFRCGIRYDSASHHRGKRSRYGYINDPVPVIVRRIYKATFNIDDQERKFVAVVVQRFVRAEQRPVFPWSFWENQLGIDAWAYGELAPFEVVRASDFSGVFALSDIDLTYGHYWITFAMIHSSLVHHLSHLFVPPTIPRTIECAYVRTHVLLFGPTSTQRVLLAARDGRSRWRAYGARVPHPYR